MLLMLIASSEPLNNVRFYTTPESLKHLSCVELPSKSTKERKGVTPAKAAAAAGSIALAAALGWAGDEFIGPGWSFFTSSMGGGLGWKLLGGEEVRQDDLPEDGGKDAKFVLDRPSRIASILSALDVRGVGVEGVPVGLEEARDGILRSLHDPELLETLSKNSKRCEETNKPQRLRSSYSRTLVDKHSYAAALSAGSAWMHAVKSARVGKPTFALVRPPSHHATRYRGMGGCLIG